MMGISARLTSESVFIKELICSASGHHVEIRTGTKFEYQVFTAFPNLNRVGDGFIQLIVHHIDSVSSLPEGLALCISLHFDEVDTFTLSNEKLHHLFVLLVKRHIDRVISTRVHAKALNKT